MKKTILLLSFLFLLINDVSAQQYCIPGRFDTTNVFIPTDLDSSVVQFGQNTSWAGSTINLFMTLYYPALAVDPLSKRPFVMIIHGGSFTHDTRDSMIDEVKYFAAKGYVSATIDYRLGWDSGNPQDCGGDNNLHINAVYRAVQDAKAALRYVSAYSSVYHIDSTEMFIGGTSSGAFASLAVAFISENDFNVVKPGITSLLGPLNSASNSLTDPYIIKGILSYKGAIWDSSVINSSNAIPTIFLHGTADPYYPYYFGNAYTCSNYFTLEGSGSLAKRLDNLDMCYELNYKVNGDHGVIYPAPYTLGRRALFMKKILCGECNQTIVENQIILQDNIITGAGNLAEYMNDFNAYPNPATNKIIIEMAQLNKTAKILIYNIAGQQVLQQALSESLTEINIADMPKGVYIIKATTEKGIKVRKFVKE
ncbi:MAG: T9SS type A sorting domain-containing protein [Bacteroidota bacterium]